MHLELRTERPPVCIVHGLWMKGHEMLLLRKRLEAAGFEVFRFSYRSVSETILENARALGFFIQQNCLSRCFFVCHSYGGLVACEYLNHFSTAGQARIVFLGTPINGATVARRMGHFWIARLIAGKSLGPLRKGCPQGLHGHHCAMIAGSVNVGLGMFFLKEDADGVVAVSDTKAPWLERHEIVGTNHLGLLFSRRVSGLCIDFLKSQGLPWSQ